MTIPPGTDIFCIFPIAGKATVEKSSSRPLRKHILLSEDRIRRNFSFPSLLDEDIIVSPIRWFEHIADHTISHDSSDDANDSNISSYNSSVCSITINSPFDQSTNSLVDTEEVHVREHDYHAFLQRNPI